MESFTDLQRAAVQRIPINRLLLETDSPYFKPYAKARMNSPMFIGEVADKVAKIRSNSVENVLHVTFKNGENLYGQD